MAKSPAKTLRLVFIGDISAVASHEPPEIDENLRAILASADLVVGNCESPVVARPRSPVATRLGIRHAMSAKFLDGVLASMRVDPARLVVSLANNHVLDQGIEGFEETLQALRQRGIRSIGTTASPAAVVPVKGINVGLLAFTQWRNTPAAEFDPRIATQARLEALNWQPLRQMQAHIRCVVPHWDWEFRHFPRPETRALASTLVTAGASLIAGHHAHVLQPLEQIQQKCEAVLRPELHGNKSRAVDNALVAYGLGDFLGTAFARQPWPGRISGMLVVDVSGDSASAGEIATYTLVPFIRQRTRRGERLVEITALQNKVQNKALTRIERIIGGANGTIAPVSTPL